MVDVHDPAIRSKNMRAIKSRDTKPELKVRSWLHAAGFRFRLHRSDLPGRPDIVLPKHHAVILVHGCFWHGHDCHMFKLPGTRTEFWDQKISSNRARDARDTAALLDAGWRVLTIWECAIKGIHRRDASAIANEVAGWVKSDVPCADIDSNGIQTRCLPLRDKTLECRF